MTNWSMMNSSILIDSIMDVHQSPGLVRGPARGVSQVACRNFKMSRVGVLSRLHNAVGNLATYICLRQSFVATFWPMSLVGIYPGRASG